MTETTIREIPLDSIDLHKRNPRSDPGDLHELAKSITQVGVLEPVVVVARGDRWAVVMGGRRTAAARKLGLVTIPAIVRDWTDDEAAIRALIENVQRDDLSPLEEADAFAASGHSTRELARLIGKSQGFVSHRVALRKCAPAVREALSTGVLTAAVAYETRLVRDPKLVARLPLREGVTVKAMAAAVARVLKRPARPPVKSKAKPRAKRAKRAKATRRLVSIELLARLERALGTSDPEEAIRQAIRLARGRRRKRS